MRKLLSILFFLPLFLQAQNNQTQVTVPIDQFGHTAHGWIYVPADYATSTTSYPVIFFYHGSGEAGTNVNTLLTQGLTYNLANGMRPDNIINPADGKAYSFIVVSLQDQYWSPSPDWLPYEMTWIKANYRVDANRIYTTGLSAGGENSFLTDITTNDAVASIPAATVVMSPAPIPSTGVDFTKISTYKINTWFLCGNSDGFLTNAQSYNTQCNAQYPNSSKLTVYTGGHCCWTTYYDVNYSDPVLHMSVFQWMLQSTKSISSSGGSGGGSPGTGTTPAVTTGATGTGTATQGPAFNPGATTITIKLSNSTFASSSYAYLKHNKTCLFLYENDDLLPSNRSTKAVFQGGVDPVNGGAYGGKTFTDGCNNPVFWRFGIGVNNVRNGGTTPLEFGDSNPVTSYLSYKEMSDYVLGWNMPEAHGWQHNQVAGFPVYNGQFSVLNNVLLNRSVTYDSLLFYGTPVVLRDGITPNSDGYWREFESAGFLDGTSTGQQNGYPSFPSFNALKFYASVEQLPKFGFIPMLRDYENNWDSAGVVRLNQMMDGLVAQSNSTTHMFYRLFSHYIPNTANFAAVMDHLSAVAGDKVWVPSPREFFEYLETKRRTVKSEVYNAATGTLIITLDQGFIPDANIFRDLSLLINTNGTISSVTFSGADNVTWSDPNKLINVFKRKTSGFKSPGNFLTYSQSSVLPLNRDGFWFDNPNYNSPNALFDGDTLTYYSAHSAIVQAPARVNYSFNDSLGFILKQIQVYQKDFGLLTPATKIWATRKVDNVNVLVDSFYNQPPNNAWHTFTVANPFVATKVFFETPGAGTRYGTEWRFIGDFRNYVEPVITNSRPRLPLKSKFGFNTYWWNYQEDPHFGGSSGTIYNPKFNRILPFTAARIYMPINSLIVSPGVYALEPAYTGGWDPDTVFARNAANGIRSVFTVVNTPKYLESTWPSQGYEHPPAVFGANLEDPHSYIDLGKFMFAAAARWGNNPNIDTSLFKLWDGASQPFLPRKNKKLVGLGTCMDYAPGNEMEPAYFQGAYMKGRQLGAFMSEMADGNMGKDGPGVGIWTACPQCRVIFPGLTTPTTDVWRGCLDIWREIRGFNPDGSINMPINVMDFHYYNDNYAHTQGAAPETYSFDSVMRTQVYTSDKYMHSIPVWHSEHGTDTSQLTILRATKQIGKTGQQVDGDFYIRTVLEEEAFGIDLGFRFQLFDNIVGPGRIIKNAATLTAGTWSTITLDTNQFFSGNQYVYFSNVNKGTAKDFVMLCRPDPNSTYNIQVHNDSSATLTVNASDRLTGPYPMSTKFNEMGLVNQNDPFYTRRVSGDFEYQVKNLMGDYVFDSRISSSPRVDKYTMTGANDIYVVWSPTEQQIEGTYVLPLPQGSTAIIHNLKEGSDNMVNINYGVPVTSCALSISYNERPVFIEVNSKSIIITPSAGNRILRNKLKKYIYK